MFVLSNVCTQLAHFIVNTKTGHGCTGSDTDVIDILEALEGRKYEERAGAIPRAVQMIEFNLILKAAGEQIVAGMFWRLLVDTVIMHACG